jgi:protein-S-isoprenylcysteine O-methyltransferase Ste14
MTSAPLEFRLRFWVIALIYLVGFLTPWDWALHLDGQGPNAHAWALLALNLAKTSGIGLDAAFNAILVVGILCAFAGAWLRTWGSAYLGAEAMLDPQLHGSAMVVDGPYRYLRNPLYLGNLGNTLALAMLMPPTGAVFAVAAVVLFQLRLILIEEPFLTARIGEGYVEYCRRVPRMLPSLRPRVAASGARGRWLEAVLAEIYQWGVAVCFLAVGWRYSERLLLRCVLVSLGVSLVVRAFPLRSREH